MKGCSVTYSYIVSPFQNCFLLSFRQIRALSLSLCICSPPSPSGPLLALLVTNYLGFVDRSVWLDDLENILVCPVLNFHIQPSGVDLLTSTGADRSWASHLKDVGETEELATRTSWCSMRTLYYSCLLCTCYIQQVPFWLPHFISSVISSVLPPISFSLRRFSTNFSPLIGHERTG